MSLLGDGGDRPRQVSQKRANALGVDAEIALTDAADRTHVNYASFAGIAWLHAQHNVVLEPE